MNTQRCNVRPYWAVVGAFALSSLQCGCAAGGNGAVRAPYFAELRSGLVCLYARASEITAEADISETGRLSLYDGRSFVEYWLLGQVGKSGQDYVFRENSESGRSIPLGPKNSFSLGYTELHRPNAPVLAWEVFLGHTYDYKRTYVVLSDSAGHSAKYFLPGTERLRSLE